MGMIGHLRQVTPGELLKLHNDPASVERLLHGQFAAPNDLAGAMRRFEEIALKAQKRGYIEDPKEREEAIKQLMQEFKSAGVDVPTDGPNEHGLSLEKSWHSLHYLLSGSAGPVESPVGKAILGGTEIGPDLGYGPARFLTPDQVKEVSVALQHTSNEDLARRFDLKAMQDLKTYACHDEEELELAQHYFGHVARYYADAASQGNAMLLYLD